MEKRRLGRSGMVVSEICLGTMTFGSQLDERESFAIMDEAYEAGIDFFDTAEIYPVPPKAEWVNRTEEIVGKWLKGKDRSSILLATKVVGPGHGWFVPPIRSGKTALDRHHIRIAIEGSLRRLQTDYVDLYQTHWPDHDFGYEETLQTLTELQEEGKVRVIGSSNETEWGTMKANQVAQENGYARYQTIQNNFSINNRRFEDALADICRREGISLLPYSPIGGGVLSGKYNNGARPQGARFSEYLQTGGERQRQMAKRFVNDKSLATTAELIELAQELNIDVVTLAVAWSKQHDFVASTIIGANSSEQLKPSLAAAGLKLSDETLQKIDAISAKYPYPMG
ncbi:MAG TPA: aldo/keto reductase [Opitutae bacterium]|nr:aldo/keto reductase [Puniceicoccaceae bacterium]HBR94301.1 aldo/keto reductase [Opitutae bacterium]|tara:strand:+ start:30 stop:1049 length:1020 start_codon:yes stop_codon:yes gene_type:complete